jgi:hypothetical protein
VFLRLNNLVALMKDDKSTRPIGMGSIYRKICSSIMLAYTFQGHPAFGGESFNQHHFANLQFGLDSKGTEKIIHFFDLFAELNPEYDQFFADGSNAFNSVSRLLGIEEAHTFFPQFTPFLMKIYNEESFGCYFGLKQGVQKIKSREGFHQGCSLASWLYCMASQPFLRKLATILQVNSAKGAVKAFIDDLNIASDTHKTLEALRCIETDGKTIGYKLNRKKGAFLLGKCSSELEALQKKNLLISEFALHPEVIKIHPENLANPDIGQVLYGAKVLGAFLGADSYIQAQLIKKEQELRAVKDAIIKVYDSQIKFLMLQWCFTNLLITNELWLQANFTNF